jgi:DNA-binding MarR family transcriptional regulator
MSGTVFSITKLTNMIYRCTQSHTNEVLKEFHLGSGAYPFLLILYNKEGINQNQISRELNVDKAMSARTIKQLTALDYIRKEEDPQDSRAYNLFLTDKAKAVIPTLKDELRKWNDAITTGMGEDEKRSLMELLSKVVENAKAVKLAER